jgi:hypothetical protein
MKFALNKVVIDDDFESEIQDSIPNPFHEEVKYSSKEAPSFEIPVRKSPAHINDILFNNPNTKQNTLKHSKPTKDSSKHTFKLQNKSNPVHNIACEYILPGNTAGLEEESENRGYRLNTNIVEVPMKDLAEITPLATGDPKFCDDCGAMFSCVSKLEENRWICEFCEYSNIVNLEPEEIPTENKLTYIIQGASQATEEREGADSDITIIFCIDTSGSMGTTSEVQNTSKLNQEDEMIRACEEFGLLNGHSLKTREDKLSYIYQHYSDNFHLDSSRSHYLTRLDCVVSAIESRLCDMALATPSRKVGIVTFNNEVNLIGDGTISGSVQEERLGIWEYCTNYVEDMHTSYFPSSISETRDTLSQKIRSLNPNGATALGPALLMSVLLASQGKPGSKVVLCTDGIANVGLGSLTTEEDREAALMFYNDVAIKARDSSVCVSILSIEGEECSLECLLTVVDKSGGTIDKVNPVNLIQDFAAALAQEVLATQVNVVVNLHKSLKFMNESSNTQRLEKKLGNVTNQDVFAFEYAVRNRLLITKIPFQVLVYYTKLNGMAFVLADTQEIEIIKRSQADINTVDFEVLSRNMKIKASNYLKLGSYQDGKTFAIDLIKNMQQNSNNSAQRAIIAKLQDDIYPFIRTCDDMINCSVDPKKKKKSSDQVTVISYNLAKKPF